MTTFLKGMKLISKTKVQEMKLLVDEFDLLFVTYKN